MSNKKLYLAISVIVLFIACLPLFTVNCVGGHDIAYHLLRIEALKTGILSGRPFLRINMLFFGGMGYASSLFYPDFLLYFPAILRALGVGINLSYHLFIALCILLGFASSFYCAKHVSKSDLAAVITAVIFTLYQYHIYDIYTRSAVGEFTAVIFVPFVIAGIYDFMYEEYKHPWFLAIGMAGVLLCHTITTVICLLLCVLSVIADIMNIKKEPGKLFRLLVTAVLVLGATAFYWMPVAEMMSTGSFSNDYYFDTSYEAAKLWEVLFNEYNRMGVAIFILLLAGLLMKNRKRFADLCTIAGIFIAVCATGIFPWERLDGLLGFIQFPWRLFVMTGPLLAFAEGIYLSQLADEIGSGEQKNSETQGSGERQDGSKEQIGSEYKSRIILIAVTAIMVVSAVANFENNTEKYYSYSGDYFEYVPFTAEVIGGEWLPTAASDREALIAQAETVLTDTGDEIAVRRYKNELFVDTIPDGTEYVDVPFIYYKGYAATNTDTKESLVTTGEGKNGCVRVYTNGAGTIRVYYKGTVVQHISDAVSIGFIIGIIAYFLVPVIKKKREAQGK